MGNDGGSIPKRDDLVKTKGKDEQANKQEQEAARWFFCTLSKQPLEEPVVSDPLGKLYNKSVALQYLLHPPNASDPTKSTFGADAFAVASHLQSLKDLTTLKLTLNPTSSPESTASQGRWMCPISLKVINGGNGKKESARWIYLKGCGCVLTETSLKHLRQGQKEIESDCLICATHFSKPEDRDVVTINPGLEEEEVMKSNLIAKRKVETEEKEKKKAAKKEKKRKAEDPSATNADESKKVATLPTSKRARAAEERGVSVAPLPTTKLASLIATQVANKTAEQSTAVASIYGPRDEKGRQLLGKQQESWMTRGTWTRFA